MTTIEIDHPLPGGDEHLDTDALIEENRSLRAYLNRVLQMLEARVANGDHLDPRTHDSAAPVPLHLADIERRLRRTEETIEDLVWMMRAADSTDVRQAD